ncbi:unnamed protein product [Cuscuta campestris]|uniref:RNase H type-1 domain-containing protein n=1 Tax=Cuscuta campestris TaxID=132261 RepID=A0A484L720_9ASTE|nr:unnamed protein product [Cuscuta campestris]
MACRRALGWAREQGLTELEVFSDCSRVVDAINGESTFLSHVGSIISDCRGLLSQFNYATLSFVPRTSNVVAHVLAKRVVMEAGICYCGFSEVYGQIKYIEISNCNGLSPKQPVFILEDSLVAACLLSGTTIHATVRRSLVGTFEKRIKEGSVYVFAYFGIGISSGNYRTSRHEFRLNFQPRTTVTACSYTMGVLTAVGKQKEIVKESKRTKMIVIQLEADGYRIKTRVVDTTDSATFVVLESVACLLLHKSCSEMLKYSENLPSGDIKPDVFNRLLIDKSYLFKVDVRRSQFNNFDPTYNVIGICFDERTISRFKERHATFFSVQTDVTLGLSTGEKSSQHTFSMGEASSCVKNLIEDFVQSKDNQFERLGDDITDSNIGKRIEEVESDYADGHEPSKKMKTIKIEKI